MKSIAKNFLLVLLVSSLGFWGCSDSLMTEPQNDISIEKTAQTNPANLPGLIPTELSVTKTINGANGGIILLAGLYINKDGRIITVLATLNIPRGAFEGTREITIATDKKDPALSFSPSMKFNVPLKLNLTFLSVDLRALGLTPWNTKFSYIGDDGTIENVPNDGIRVDLLRGLLSVNQARIVHFSRLGFTR